MAKGRRQRCSRCRGEGHNIATCERLHPQKKKFRLPEPWDPPEIASETVDAAFPFPRRKMKPGSRGLEHRCHICHKKGHDMSTCPDKP